MTIADGSQIFVSGPCILLRAIGRFPTSSTNPPEVRSLLKPNNAVKDKNDAVVHQASPKRIIDTINDGRKTYVIGNTTDSDEENMPEMLRCKRRMDFSSLGLPRPAPGSMVRRNERERNRVKQVNLGFESLRQHVPQGRKNKKLSKVDTLKEAVRYIRHLQQLLTDSPLEEPGDSPTTVLFADDALSDSSIDMQTKYINYCTTNVDSSTSRNPTVFPPFVYSENGQLNPSIRNNIETIDKTPKSATSKTEVDLSLDLCGKVDISNNDEVDGEIANVFLNNELNGKKIRPNITHLLKIVPELIHSEEQKECSPQSNHVDLPLFPTPPTDDSDFCRNSSCLFHDSNAYSTDTYIFGNTMKQIIPLFTTEIDVCPSTTCDKMSTQFLPKSIDSEHRNNMKQTTILDQDNQCDSSPASLIGRLFSTYHMTTNDDTYYSRKTNSMCLESENSSPMSLNDSSNDEFSKVGYSPVSAYGNSELEFFHDISQVDNADLLYSTINVNDSDMFG